MPYPPAREVAAEHARKALSLRDQFELGPKLTARAGLSEDERNQLRALGYLQD